MIMLLTSSHLNIVLNLFLPLLNLGVLNFLNYVDILALHAIRGHALISACFWLFWPWWIWTLLSWVFFLFLPPSVFWLDKAYCIGLNIYLVIPLFTLLTLFWYIGCRPWGCTRLRQILWLLSYFAYVFLIYRSFEIGALSISIWR